VAYNHHLHKDLLQLTNQLLKDRDSKQLITHIGKVKSHTDVEYNETADITPRAVVDGDNIPDITFEDADPPIGGLRTWPQIRHNPPNKPEHIRKRTNLKAYIRKELKHTNITTTTKGVFGRLLQEARDTGTYFSIQAYSQSLYRSIRDAYEVSWRSHVYRCKKKHNSQGPMLCIKCNQSLTSRHLLGGCKYNSELRTSRHNNTFKLLQEQFQKHNGGRWSIVSMDIGNKAVKDFTNQMKIEMTTLQEDTTIQVLEATQEGVQNDKATT
jgi:hypothetical protein